MAVAHSIYLYVKNAQFLASKINRSLKTIS